MVPSVTCAHNAASRHAHAFKMALSALESWERSLVEALPVAPMNVEACKLGDKARVHNCRGTMRMQRGCRLPSPMGFPLP